MKLEALLERASTAAPKMRTSALDLWGPLMPVMNRLVKERGFTSEEAAKWIAENGAIDADKAGRLALSYRQREMRRRRRERRVRES